VYTALFFSPSLCVFFLFCSEFLLCFALVLLYFPCFSSSVFWVFLRGSCLRFLSFFSSSSVFVRLCFFSPIRPSCFFFLLFFFFLCRSWLFFSALPFIEPESFKTSPVFAGLLFKSRTGSWAGDVVHDLLQISCWIGFLRAKRKGWWTVLPNGAVCVLGNGYFSLWPLNIIKSTIGILISNN